MSYINICSLIVAEQNAAFQTPFRFSVTLECLQPIEEELEWKVIYVGCPRDDAYDQELDNYTLGPFNEQGVLQFDLEVPAPDPSKIPTEDILGVSAIIHSVSYRKQEFFRVGYFVYNNYEDPLLQENPYPIQIDKLVRSILIDKPRIIRYNVDWENESTEKVKALNEILFENANVINVDNTIQFRGMFSDVALAEKQNMEAQKAFGDNNGMNWANAGFQGQNNFGFSESKENFSDHNIFSGMGKQMNPFTDNAHQQQKFGQNDLWGQNNGGGFGMGQQNMFQPQNNGNQGFSLTDISNIPQQMGNSFGNGNPSGRNFFM